MSRIAILGLGTMGAGVARHLVSAGNRVTVWNRTSIVATDFAESTGAQAAVDLAQAVLGAEVVLSFLSDDKASHSVWSTALALCEPGALVVECSTISPERATAFVAAAVESGLESAVALMIGSKTQVDAGTLIFLVGGSETVMTRLAPALEPTSAGVRFIGEPKTAAMLKLSVNTILAVQLAGMAEIKRVTESLDMGSALDLVTDLPLFSPTAVALLGRMRGGNFTPNFSVDLIEKDLGYMAQTAHELNVDVAVVSAVRATFSQASQHGLGNQDFTVIGR